ncbi:MAG: coniferyl-aldehyde dehydrogenase [Myxococcota bacterium]|jgi:coniferyl-aldehyde dehydrogenase
MNAAPDTNTLDADFAHLKATSRSQGPLSYKQRVKALKALSKVIRRRREDIVSAISNDFGGRSRHETLSAEIFTSVAGIRHTLANLKDWMEPETRPTFWAMRPARCEVRYQPLGVVGVISPWNYPVYLAISPIVAALSAGNRVMLKPSEVTPTTSGLLSEILTEALGKDIAAVSIGDHQVGAAFSRLPFDHLLFTGSTGVGRLIMAAASDNLTPVTLELGGKSPVILHDSYSVRRAAPRIVYGKLLNAGQTCIAPDYVLCPSGKVGALVEAITAEVGRRYPTLKDNPDYTAIVSDRHHARLSALLADAESKGAELVAINPAGEDLSSGRRMVPTLVLNPTEDMDVMKEEIFGPILPIVPTDSADAALDYVNHHPRPLALYYFDGSRRRIRSVLDATTSGGVTINDTILHVSQEDLPFGGVGPSGMGAYHGFEGFETFSHKKGILHQSRLSLTPALIRPPYGRLMSILMKLLIR